MTYILQLLKKHKLLVTGIVISTVLHSTFALANSWYSKYVFDSIAMGQAKVRDILLLGLLVTLWGAGSLLLKNISVDVLIGKITFHLRNSFARAVVNSPVAKLKGLDEGRIMNSYSQDIGAVAGFVRSGMDLIVIPFEMIISVLFLYFFNWKLATVVIVLFPIILFCGKQIGKKVQEISKHYLSKDDKNMKLLARIVKGIEVIKVHRYEGMMAGEFETNTMEQLALDKKRAKYNGTYSGITDFFMGLPFVIVYVSSAIMLSDNSITVGTLTLFLQLLNKITVPFVVYSRVLMQFKKAKVSIERLNEIMETDGEIEVMPTGFDRVAMKNVSFGYKGNDSILKDCTFSFEPDTYYGVMGANGCGKSTACKLLMNLYTPDAGAVEYVKNAEKVNKIVFIEDKPAILFDDIVQNIVGDKELEPEKLQRILAETELKTATADNTEKKADELSAGLLQRMVIARALYQIDMHDVLFIDEGFSALDAEMRLRMYDLIKSYKKKYHLTIFDITHNVNECERFDRVLTVEEGKIR